MCGIVGALSAAPVNVSTVERMRDRLAHRGPDARGVWQRADSRVCFGHRRLAIIDPAPDADQPMRSADGRFCITFNGEIYNHRALRRELEAVGVRFRTRSDTEVLIEAWRTWGHGCLSRLSGMFAFALWDEQTRTMYCARDRAGEKPFHYAIIENAFVFASELKAITEWEQFRGVVDAAALIDFFTFGFILDPRTVWQGVRKLPAGHWMQIELPNDGAPRASAPQAYWDLTFDPDFAERDWGERLRETLREAADEMSVADVPLGTFLSGGVDSSAVTAALSLAGHDVRSFTIGFDDHAFDERPWAREVADLYHTTHRATTVAASDLAALSAVVATQFDEPFGDYSALPTLALCQMARRDITVALSGDGGDEVFAGYSRYRRVSVRALADSLAPFGLARAGASVGRRFAQRPSTARTLDQYAAAPAPMFADMLTLGLRRPALRALARGSLAAELSHYDPVESIATLLKSAPPAEVGLVNSMRYLDFKTTLTSGILTKVDRASMAVALEVRPVFLHHALLSLAGQIPPAALAGPRRTKHALKRALEPWLPSTVLYRKKMGFALPLGDWLRGDDAASLERRDQHESLATYLDLDAVSAMRGAHRAGVADHKASLFNVGVFAQWLAAWT